MSFALLFLFYRGMILLERKILVFLAALLLYKDF